MASGNDKSELQSIGDDEIMMMDSRKAAERDIKVLINNETY